MIETAVTETDMEEDKSKNLFFDDPEDGGIEPIEIPSEEEMTDDVVETEEAAEVVGESEPLPVDVIEEAVGYGLTSSDIEKLGTEENISAVLEILDRQEKPTPSESGSSSGPDDEDDFDPFGEDDESVPNEDSKQMAALKSQVERLARLVTQQKADTEDQSKLFDQFASEYDDLFGDDAADLTQTQQRNRDKVVTEMETIKAGYKAKNRKVPANRRLMKQAVNSVFGDHETKVQRKKFSESVKKRQGQFISRVNARDNRGLKDSRGNAIDSVKAFLADKGYTDLSSTETCD